MRTGILLFVISFSLLAAGDTIDYSGAGSLSNGTASQSGSPSAGRTWSVTSQLIEINDTSTGHMQEGNLGHVDISTGRLSVCASGLCFTGGSLDITDTSGNVLVDMAFTSGTVSHNGGNTFLNAILPRGGTTQIESKAGVFSSNSIVATTAHVVPEADSLLLMGTGIIGIWFFGREQLKRMGRCPGRSVKSGSY